MPHPIQDSVIERELNDTFGVSLDHIEQARRLSVSNQLGLIANLKQMGVLSEKQAVDAESKLFGVTVVSLKKTPLNPQVVSLIPENIRGRYQLIPISKQGNILTIAISSLIRSQSVLSELRNHTSCFVNFVLAYPSDIGERLVEFSKHQQHVEKDLEVRAKELSSLKSINRNELQDPHGPVAEVINLLLSQSVTEGASDIHFEPLAQSLRVRFRKDGILREVKTFDKVFIAPFCSAIKIMASMDIAETRIPQDGSFNAEIAGRSVSFRVATYPTSFGENIVIRILDSNRECVTMDSLLLSQDIKNELLALIEKPYGLILCAGPTGSGKTTTQYAVLSHLNSPKKNIVTIEDPVEYRIAGISQAQVNLKKGFTFATGLRAILRLDPNVILVGEMRDVETASIGVQAALTGHLVLSTVHANSAVQTVARLVDMGVESFTVASSLLGVISQRLLRRVCENCREPYKPAEKEVDELGIRNMDVEYLYRGRGCGACYQEGYKGRIPIVEILSISNEMRAIISRRSEPGKIIQMAVQNGMKTIQQDAMEKLLSGMTSSEEVLNVIGGLGVSGKKVAGSV